MAAIFPVMKRILPATGGNGCSLVAMKEEL